MYTRNLRPWRWGCTRLMGGALFEFDWRFPATCEQHEWEQRTGKAQSSRLFDVTAAQVVWGDWKERLGRQVEAVSGRGPGPFSYRW